MGLLLSRTAGFLLLTFGVILFYALSLMRFRTSTSFFNHLGRQQQQHEERLKMSSISTVVILVSQPRSGSTFLGKFIEGFESMFYIYEPLQALLKLKDFNGKSTEYNLKAKLFLEQLLNCHFTSATEGTLSEVYNGFFRRASANICKQLTRENIYLCDKQRTKLFNHVCSKYRTLFVKLLEPRLPVDLSTLISMASNVNYRMVYLLRDPRASFWSVLQKGWVTSEHNHKFKEYITVRCKEMYLHLRGLERVNNEIIRRKIVILRYEDVVQKPLKTTRILSNFLNKEISDDYIDKFMLKIRKKISCHGNEGHSSGKAWLNWYTDAGEDFIEFVQGRCEAFMNLTGYKFRKKENMTGECSGHLVVEKDSVDLLNDFTDEYDDELIS